MPASNQKQSVTVEQLQQLREELETNVASMLQSFENSTGVEITDLHIQRASIKRAQDVRRRTIITSLEVNIAL